MAEQIKVTADDLKAATWRMVSHINMGRQGHHFTYSATVFPELLVCKGWNKVRGERKRYAFIEVRNGDQAQEVHLTDLEGAAQAVSRIRQSKVDDATWAEAAPKEDAAA